MNNDNLLKLMLKNIYFFGVRKKIFIKNIFHQNINNQHLFILSPPYCGSTLLNEIISSSKNVSCNNNIGNREGHNLPETKKILFNLDKWDPDKEINWKEIHAIWDKYWDKSKHVLLEKSPPNICRALKIEKEFQEAKFICLLRNPYAQAEGIIRRNNASAKYAADFALKCLEYQKTNLEMLKNVTLITYEDLTKNPENTKQKIISFVPELNDIDTSINFSAHNLRGAASMPITNLNKEKIAKIKKPELEIINSIFKKKESLLNYFDYKILD